MEDAWVRPRYSGRETVRRSGCRSNSVSRARKWRFCVAEMKSCCGRKTETWCERSNCWQACRTILRSPTGIKIGHKSAKVCDGSPLFIGHEHLYLHPAEKAGGSSAPVPQASPG